MGEKSWQGVSSAGQGSVYQRHWQPSRLLGDHSAKEMGFEPLAPVQGANYKATQGFFYPGGDGADKKLGANLR
jgi:hypothetical protein